MNDFSYSVIRSFNQHMAANLGTDVLQVSGSVGSLILNWHPANFQLSNDAVTCHFHDEVINDIGGGRYAGGTKGRVGEFQAQVDVWSPPNRNGEPRQGANRQFKDKVEEVLKPKVRINLIDYGTAGTSVKGGMYIRQTRANWMPVEEMDGWCRWSLGFTVKAVDHD